MLCPDALSVSFLALFGRPFIKRFALCYRFVVCLSACLSVQSCLSVTLVYYGWIKMNLDVEVGLCPGHIVLDGDPAPPPQRGTSPLNFRVMSVVAKRLVWINVTW